MGVTAALLAALTDVYGILQGTIMTDCLSLLFRLFHSVSVFIVKINTSMYKIYMGMLNEN